MLLKKSNNLIQAVPSKAKEDNILRTFPGFITHLFDYYLPFDRHICRNLIERLKAQKIEVEASEEVFELVTSEDQETIPEDFQFLTEPLPHQLQAFLFALGRKNSALLLDPGLGKTKVVLDFIAARKFRKSLIVCPKALLFVWRDEVAKHRWDKSVYVIKGTSWENEQKEIEAADIVVLNYNKASILEKQLVKLKPDFLGLDEALIKDPYSLRTETLTRMGKKIPYKMLMSGTLVNNSVLDVFAPVRFLEPSLTGKAFSTFRDRYCYMIKEKLKPGETRKARVFQGSYRNIPEARSILEAVSIVMKKEKWLRLPDKKFFPIYIPMSEAQRSVYFDLAENYITSLERFRDHYGEEDFVEVDSPLTVMCKLTQVSNGFVYKNIEGDIIAGEEELCEVKTKKKKGKRQTFFFYEQPKVNRLKRLLTEELSGRKVVLWFNMKAEATLIEECLKELGISYRSIGGGDPNIEHKVKEFNEDSDIKVLVCQAKSVNYGLTILGKKNSEDEDLYIPELTISTLVYTHVFYSLNFSLEVFLQQQDRSHRIGQTMQVEYYLLLSNNPTDIGIWDRLQEKIEIRESVLVDILLSNKGKRNEPITLP